LTDETEARRAELYALAKDSGLEPHSRTGVAKLEEMLTEAGVEFYASATPVEPDAEEQAPARTVARAKSHIEVENERKEAEAAAAREARRSVERAKTLQETQSDDKPGDPNKVVEVRITKKGEGRVQTGNIVNGSPEFYAKGEVVEMNEAAALSNERKGYVEVE
jgi:flagellar motility protein MotE (MotC chaperone)